MNFGHDFYTNNMTKQSHLKVSGAPDNTLWLL